MLTTLEHALTKFFLKAASSASMMNTAIDAVHTIAIAAEVPALNGMAACIHTVVIEAERVPMGRNTAASNSLLPPPPCIFNFSWLAVLINYYDILWSTVYFHVLVTIYYVDSVAIVFRICIELGISMGIIVGMLMLRILLKRILLRGVLNLLYIYLSRIYIILVCMWQSIMKVYLILKCLVGLG